MCVYPRHERTPRQRFRECRHLRLRPGGRDTAADVRARSAGGCGRAAPRFRPRRERARKPHPGARRRPLAAGAGTRQFAGEDAQARAHQSRDRGTTGCGDWYGSHHARRRRRGMSHINVTINGRQYRMACEEGQEVRLLKLAESFEARIGSLRGKFGEIGDARLTVRAALTVCDELLDANARILSLEEELAALRDVRTAAADRARATQTAVAAALNSAAERIEKTTQALNRTIGGGIAMG